MQEKQLQEAVAYHQRGDLARAEAMYAQLLGANADHADAKSLLGTLRVQQGKLEEGIALLTSVLRTSPNHPLAAANLGLAYHELGAIDDAIGFYRRAIEIDGGSEQSINNLACALRERGEHAEAEKLLTPLVQRKTTFSPAYYNLALIAKSRHQEERAIALLRQAVALQPDYAAAYFQLGNSLRDAGDLAGSLAALERATEIMPAMFEAWDSRGVTLLRLGRLNEALQSHQRALELAPDVPEVHGSYAACLQQAGKMQGAIAHFRRALELKPDYDAAWANLARALTETGQSDEAVSCADRALALDPDMYVAHINRGAALLELGRDDEAQREFEWCLARNPNNIAVLVNLGTLASYQGQTLEALARYEQAVAVDSGDAMANWNHACALLASGDLERGWKKYDWGLRTVQRALRKSFDVPRWRGEDIHDKRLLIVAEQGVGDEIQLASCLNDVVPRASKVIVQCDPRLGALYRRSFPQLIIHASSRDEDPAWVKQEGGADVRIEMASLLPMLRPRLEDFRGKSSYLRPDPARVAHWRSRLAALGPQPKVGFAWRSRLHKNSRSRHYPPLDAVAAILQTPGVAFVNLQYDDCTDELRSLRALSGTTVHSFDDVDLFDDFDDSAALMQALDLVIAPATTTFVLAAAVGTPAWQMCACTMEAWLFGQEKHVWFDNARLYRQHALYHWDEVAKRIARDLADWAQDNARTDASVANDRTNEFDDNDPILVALARPGATVVNVDLESSAGKQLRRCVGAQGRVLDGPDIGIDRHGLTALDLVRIGENISAQAVIANGENTLRRCRPILLFERGEVCGRAAMAGMLLSLGYRTLPASVLSANGEGASRTVCVPVPLTGETSAS